MVVATKQMKCCICEMEIDNGMDYHNPAPLGKSGDVCCTYCNITKVIPARLKQVTKKITLVGVKDKHWYRKKYE
jgi:hypothetical protein